MLSTSSDATERLAAKLGSLLRGGEVIELVSDLGGGKTTFVRGLARGMGSKEHVASPTFTISRIYKAPRLTLHHFDFYRLPEAGVVVHELEEVLAEPDSIVVIEWPGIVEAVLPARRLKIEIKVTGEETRAFNISYDEGQAYLVEGIK